MHRFVKANPDLCIGCRTCMIGCVVAHKGLHIFEVDPDSYTFDPRLHMVKTAKISAPVQCKHCENPACMAVCSEGCITQTEEGVFIDTAKCIGCKSCMVACPFGAIDMVPVAGSRQADGRERVVANKCDLCRGLPGGPACVRVCPTAALQLVEEETLETSVERKRLEAARSLTASKGI